MDIEKVIEQISRRDGLSHTLAENLAGIASLALCPGKIAVGINVTGSHVKAVLEGDTVTARARLLHKGTTLHQWHIELTNGVGELISTVAVTNYIIKGERPPLSPSDSSPRAGEHNKQEQ